MNNKEIYFTPTLDVEVIKIEQGIAQTSSGAASSPQVQDWETGIGAISNGEGS